ncbi:MAG: hypothetical protein OEY93_03075 [Anaerolineae bacterium]|nr:hypothetical protein [Anaerolineae bacterium]
MSQNNEDNMEEKEDPILEDSIVISEEAEEALAEIQEEGNRKKRMWLLLLLLLLLLCSCGLFVRYLVQPEPLPDIILPFTGPGSELSYPPHYLFSIYGLSQPVGVTLSPDEQLIYVSESGDERLIKVFDRSGNPVNSFAPPDTTQGYRSPVYMDTDDQGQLYVTDRLQHSIVIYSREGKYLDSILGTDLLLSEFIAKHIQGNMPEEITFSYNIITRELKYKLQEDGEEFSLPDPDPAVWAPLGLWINKNNDVFITDVFEGQHRVLTFKNLNKVKFGRGEDFDPKPRSFGASGQNAGEFLYPNKVVVDSQGRYYVSDGNNGRISVWGDEFLYQFGRGTGDGALSLPRGLMIDDRDRLYVVDAVDHAVKVYDVSGDEPIFLFKFGNLGIDDGLFNFPNDIAIDSTGRLYITDRENQRIQVWSY